MIGEQDSRRNRWVPIGVGAEARLTVRPTDDATTSSYAMLEMYATAAARHAVLVVAADDCRTPRDAYRSPAPTRPPVRTDGPERSYG
jgi:hypothetical protein